MSVEERLHKLDLKLMDIEHSQKMHALNRFWYGYAGVCMFVVVVALLIKR